MFIKNGKNGNGKNSDEREQDGLYDNDGVQKIDGNNYKDLLKRTGLCAVLNLVWTEVEYAKALGNWLWCTSQTLEKLLTSKYEVTYKLIKNGIIYLTNPFLPATIVVEREVCHAAKESANRDR